MMASATPASATPMPPAMSQRRDRTVMTASPGLLYAGSRAARLWPPGPRAFPGVELASPEALSNRRATAFHAHEQAPDAPRRPALAPPGAARSADGPAPRRAAGACLRSGGGGH